MRKIRIGKDISVRWAIELPEGSTETLGEMSLTLLLSCPCGGGSKTIDFTVDDDTIVATLLGRDFQKLGDYSLTLWKNKGLEGQTVVDARKAFRLVASTDQEDNAPSCGCERLETSTVDLQSELLVEFLGYFNDPAIIARIEALEARVEALERQEDSIVLAGSLSYPATAPASGGTLTPTSSLTLQKNGIDQSVTFSYASDRLYASVNSTTGVVTFSASQSASQRSATITASCTFEGQVYSRTATVTQAAYEATVYSVSRTLTGVISSNTDNSVNEGSSYTTTLTLASGYQNMSVTVTMGGVDITSSALSGNVVSIASVSGNVVITATATQIPVEVEYIYGGGAFSTASSISHADLVIDTTVDASTKTITFGVDNQNHIGIIAPASLALTSCLHIDAITEDLTAEFASSAQTITYHGKTMKLYQVKSTAGKMYNTTFRANFS